MSKQLISNANILQMFQEINAVKSDETLSDSQKNRKVKKIQDDIIVKLSFLVHGQTRIYRSFPNYEDLVQEGFLGLLKAVRKFDCNAYANFFAYAEQWIRHSVKRAASRFDVVYNPNKTRVVYSEPDENEIDFDADPEEIWFDKEKKNGIEKILNEFPERDREIVNRIFGLGGHDPQTLREIGPQFNLTYERVRQIKNNVMDKLKQHQDMLEMSFK